MDFDAFDQGTDDLALRIEVNRIQSLVDSVGKFLKTIDHQKELELPDLISVGLFNLKLDLLQLDLHLRDLWIEVRFIDNTVRVAVDESRLAFLQMTLLFFQCRCIGIDVFVPFERIHPALVFLLQSLGMRQ